MSARELTDSQRRWIDCVVEMAERGPDEWTGYMTEHYVFQRKVLGRPKMVALSTAARVQNTPLNRATCEHIARNWWKCRTCDEDVRGSEDDRCPRCQQMSASSPARPSTPAPREAA